MGGNRLRTPCPLAAWTLLFAFLPGRIEAVGQDLVISPTADYRGVLEAAEILSSEAVDGYGSVSLMIDLLPAHEAIHRLAPMMCRGPGITQRVEMALSRVDGRAARADPRVQWSHSGHPEGMPNE